MTADTERPAEAIDEQITRQAMDPRRHPTLTDVLHVLNQRCVRCGSWLTDEARCLNCGGHQ